MSEDPTAAALLCKPSATRSAPAATHPIVGVWRLLAHQTIFEDGEVVNHFGPDPRGRLILMRSGHMMGFVVDPRREASMTVEARAELHRSMIAYSGTYRIVGDRFIVAVDLSWHQMWTGTEQARTFRVEEPHLHIVSAPTRSSFRADAISHGRLLWHRENADVTAAVL